MQIGGFQVINAVNSIPGKSVIFENPRWTKVIFVTSSLLYVTAGIMSPSNIMI